jgi:hypothetical protein
MEKMKLLTRVVLFFSFFLFTFAFSSIGHTQAPQNAHGVVRLKVRYKSAEGTKDLPRKRFFLIKGSINDNKSLIEKIKQMSLTSLECFYRSHGASEALIKWLKDNDCESVYCREIEDKYLSGAEAVPEFQKAFEQALNELKNREVARRWLPNYLVPVIRSGFYEEQQKAIHGLLPETQSAANAGFMSIMTDRKGTAYLTNIEPGTYTISNVVPSETEKTSILWICEREVKATDLGTAMKRPMMLSNEKDPKVKCEVIERPLPVCK